MFCCDSSCAHTPTPTPALDAQGRRIFSVNSGAQFVIVVEAVPGLSGALPGKSLTPIPPTNRSDLQIQSNRNLGTNPTTVVCDTGPTGGGIPSISPTNYAEDNQMVTDAMNDFACRFRVFNVAGPCTKVDATQEPAFVTKNAPVTTVQFCDQVSTLAAFPTGDTVVTVKVRDANGDLGPARQIVIRVATPTPKP